MESWVRRIESKRSAIAREEHYQQWSSTKRMRNKRTGISVQDEDLSIRVVSRASSLFQVVPDLNG